MSELTEKLRLALEELEAVEIAAAEKERILRQVAADVEARLKRLEAQMRDQ